MRRGDQGGDRLAGLGAESGLEELLRDSFSTDYYLLDLPNGSGVWPEAEQLASTLLRLGRLEGADVTMGRNGPIFAEPGPSLDQMLLDRLGLDHPAMEIGMDCHFV